MVALTLASAPAGSLSGQTREPRPASSYATAVGTPLRTIIVFGDQYNGGDELYDAKITVAEIVRGEEAWQMVKAASASKNTSPPGPWNICSLACVLNFLPGPVRSITATRSTRRNSPRCRRTVNHTPRPFSPRRSSRRCMPRFAPGDSAEGWVAFLVPRGDHTPLMLFREDVGSVIHEGNGSIFKLYDEKSLAPGRAKAS